MPLLGADMEAGTLIEWLKKPGEAVRRGDIVAVVDTQKGAIEIEVFDDGVIDQVLVPPGQKVPVGTVLALLRAAGEPVQPVAVQAQTAGAAPERRRISPAARKAAEELHVDLAAVAGTGPGGSVTRGDVERAASPGGTATPQSAATPSAAPRSPEPVQGAPAGPAAAAPDRASAMRAAIGAAMARSKREIPHLYLATTIDMSVALAWLTAENARRRVIDRLLPVVLLLKAVGRAATEVPEVNGFWIGSGFRPGPGVHIGCAISLRDGGLVAPALHDVPARDIGALMRDLADLIARARAGSLRSSELADPTLTVTNLGDLGVESTFGIIYPPQVALVGFGRIVERPWVVDGRIEARPVVTATVSADHRAVDGRRAGLFLEAINRWLQRPEEL